MSTQAGMAMAQRPEPAAAASQSGAWSLPAGLILLSLGLAALSWPLVFSGPAPSTWLPSWPCPFHQVTGWPCPLCGMTRAFACMGRLEVAQAVRFNASGCALYVFLCLYALRGWVGVMAGRRRGGLFSHGQWVPVLGALIITDWLLRLAGLY